MIIGLICQMSLEMFQPLSMLVTYLHTWRMITLRICGQILFHSKEDDVNVIPTTPLNVNENHAKCKEIQKDEV